MKEIITDLSQLNPAEVFKIDPATPDYKVEGDEIINALKEVLTANEDLLALSAPQIGYDKQIVCIKFNDGIKTFIDPVVKEKKGNVVAIETCASMPGKEILIGRPEEVTLVYYTDKYEYEDNKLTGAAAALFDQQYQLMFGVTPELLGLVSDVKEDGKFSELTEEEQKQAVEIYDKVIKMRKDALEASINSDDEIAKQYRQLKFSENVVNGRTKVVDLDADKKMADAKKMAMQSIVASNKSKQALQKAQYRQFAARAGKRHK